MGKLKDKLRNLEKSGWLKSNFRVHVLEYNGHEKLISIERISESGYNLRVYPNNCWFDFEHIVIENLGEQDLEKTVSGCRRGFENEVNKLIKEEEKRRKEMKERLLTRRKSDREFDELADRCFNSELW